jgi:predicted negative regulator of RcsB-dependent stress response
MKRNLIPITLAGLLLLSASVSGFAQENSVPQVHGQMLRDFVRLTFEWPEPTLFTAKASGNEVTLTFDRKANPDMAAMLRDLSPYVVSAQRKADGKTIVLTLDKPHRIRTFVSDNISGIDLLDVKGGPQLAKAQPTPMKMASDDSKAVHDFARLVPSAGGEETPVAPLAEPEKQNAEPVAEPTPAPEAAEVKATEPAQAEPVATSEPTQQEPATPGESALAAPVAEPTSTIAEAAPIAPAAEAAQTATTEAATPAEQAVSAVKPEETKPAEADASKHENNKTEDNTVTALDESAKEKAPVGTLGHDVGISMVPMALDHTSEENTEEAKVEDKEAKSEENVQPTAVEASQDEGAPEPLISNRIVVSADQEGATLRFPLKERTAMALFIRVNMLWVVFDKKIDFDLSEFESLPSTIIGKATVVENKSATVLRIPVSDNIYPEVKQQEGQLDLAVILSAKKELPDAQMELTISTEPPAPAHVFVPALEVGKSVEVADPDIGDNLIITPLYEREQGIAATHEFVEFDLLASTQGLAVVKKADGAEVTVLRNGLRISTPNGASLSPQLLGAEPVQAVKATALGTLFPADMWMLEKNKNMKIAMNNLLWQSVFATNDGAKNLARLRMAQLYLHDGFVVEAIGMLNSIQRANPAYFRSAKLAAMRGAANFLLYRFNDAARDFGAAELNNNAEVAYWRDMLADLLGSPDKTSDFLAMNDNYISKYPAIFRQRLAIVAADRAIAAKEYNAALKIFDTLAKDKIIEPIQPYVDFLTAKISAENGQEQEALEVWKRLSEDDRNKFVKARATFSAILWQLDNNILTREQAMDKLERLRLGWHGDGLELQIVQLLGDLYFDKHDYVNAMRVWQIGVTGFKNTGPAIEMARKMEDTFIRLFNEGVAEKMTPLEALALYYEYRNYTPAGATGTQMIEKLSDRLVGVDLLSTAAQLLEQQMRTQMEKTERSRVGAKLANIYLMNNQPKRAMKALQDSVYGDNPILQRVQRNQLTARAMMQLGRPQEALSVLGSDESSDAEKIRAMIYWNEKDWSNITSSIENIFKMREDPAALLNAEDGEFVLRLALSYVFQNDSLQLQYMRDYFGPLMRNNPYKEAFDFVTAPDMKLTTRNFDELLQTLANTRGFINNYKAHIELADGSDAAPVVQP